MHKNRGFTLVELLIVIVVIAILAVISVVAYNGIQTRAYDAKRKDDLAKIAKGLTMWTLETGGRFEEMNTGWVGNGGTGWHNYDYGVGSVESILISSGYLSPGTKEPNQTTQRGYLLTHCTGENDNRRVLMAHLDHPPTQAVQQQIASANCTSSYINTGVNNYGAYYAIVINGS